MLSTKPDVRLKQSPEALLAIFQLKQLLILHFLELKGMPMSMRNYYLRREEAINVLSSVLWGYTSTDCEELINRLLPE